MARSPETSFWISQNHTVIRQRQKYKAYQRALTRRSSFLLGVSESLTAIQPVSQRESSLLRTMWPQPRAILHRLDLALKSVSPP